MLARTFTDVYFSMEVTRRFDGARGKCNTALPDIINARLTACSHEYHKLAILSSDTNSYRDLFSRDPLFVKLLSYSIRPAEQVATNPACTNDFIVNRVFFIRVRACLTWWFLARRW